MSRAAFLCMYFAFAVIVDLLTQQLSQKYF